jgi:O-antigen/teichoic acid export membrane protein
VVSIGGVHFSRLGATPALHREGEMISKFAKLRHAVDLNAFLVLCIRVSAAALSYIIFVYIARSTPVDVYTEFALVFSIVGFFAPLAAAGQDKLAIKHISPVGRLQPARVVAIVRNQLLPLAAGTLSCTALAATMVWLTLEHPSGPVILLCCGLVAVSGFNEYLFSVYRALGNVVLAIFNKELLWRLTFFMVFAAALWLWNASNIEEVLSFYFISVCAAATFLLLPIAAKLRSGMGAPQTRITASSSTESVLLLGLTAINMAMVHADVIILGMFGNDDDVGPYFSAQRVVQVLYFFIASTSIVAARDVSIGFHAQNYREISKISRRAARHAGGLVLLLFIPIVLLASDILGFFNTAFEPYAHVLTLLAMGPVAYTLGGLHGLIPALCGLERPYFAWRLGILMVFITAKVLVASTARGPSGMMIFAALVVAEITSLSIVGVWLCRVRLHVRTF